MSSGTSAVWDLSADEQDAPVASAPSRRKVISKKPKKAAGEAGELATAMLGQLSKDRKTWAALAEECADGSAMPDESILRRLAPAFEMEPDHAASLFESDVAAVKSYRRATWLDKKNKEKLKKLHSEHGTGRELSEQIEAMLIDLRQLRLLARRVHSAESQGHNWAAARAKNQAQRVFENN